MSDYVQDDVDLDDIKYVAVAFDGEVLVGKREQYQRIKESIDIFQTTHTSMHV